MKLRVKIFSLVLIATMLTCCMFFIPSAEITPQAKQNYLNNMSFSFEEDDLEIDLPIGFDVFIKKAYAAESGLFGINPVIPIPIEDMSGRPASEELFTDNSYEDNSIKVKMEEGRYEGSDYYAAFIEIVDASQLRTGLAGNLGSSRTIKTSLLAPKFNAVVAINGDYYSQTIGGLIVRQGEVYRKKVSSNIDLLLIDSVGDFHILTRGKEEQTDAIQRLYETKEIVNGFFFGPALVIDGQIQTIPENYQFDPFKENPRAAIAQIGPLKYVLVVVTGRLDNSPGLTLPDFSKLMKSLGSYQAYNLDGGNSAALFFHDGLFNPKSLENERDVSDIIYFCSAEMN